MGGQGSHALGEEADYKGYTGFRCVPPRQRIIALSFDRVGIVDDWSAVVDMGDNGTAVPTTLVASEEFRR